MTKLTIVVNCTERKSQTASPELQARTLPSGDVSTRFQVWKARVQKAPPSAPLIDLYQGEAWQQVRGLADDATRLGFRVTLKVASAGLGLRDVYSKGPAYAATFAGGHEDTVVAPGLASRLWWQGLQKFDDADSLVETAGAKALLVLSETYARAMEDDLNALAAKGGDFLVVGGSRDIEGLPRLPADMGLRRQFGGTASSITLRMARRWLAQRQEKGLYHPADVRRWSTWARSKSELERYDREPATDHELRRVIRQLKKADPSLSATRALRTLRDSGVACEQKRFGALFRETGVPR